MRRIPRDTSNSTVAVALSVNTHRTQSEREHTRTPCQMESELNIEKSLL